MLPTFVIIGTMKGGTTSLYYYLGAHPEISMSRLKETDFFIKELNFHKGIDWYERNFTGKAKAYGETSPNYTKHPAFSGVPERMHSVLPDVKLVYLLRDPVERIISHYIHNYSRGAEKRSINEALSNPGKNHYVQCSRYHMQLEQYLKYYSEKNILIIRSEDLRDQRRETLREIFSFLEVDASFYSKQFSELHHRSSDKRKRTALEYKMVGTKCATMIRSVIPSLFLQTIRRMTEKSIEMPELDHEVEEKLTDCLQEDVDSMRKYTGQAFSHWCV